MHHDTTIFSLAALLCSTLIFNGASSIDEASVQNLGFIANLTKHITVRSSAESGGGGGGGGGAGGASSAAPEELNRFFPNFLWVLRDFVLALVDDNGGDVSSDEYMETSLAEQPGYDKETLARNRIRKCVKAFFRDRHCFTLVRPVEGEDDLQSLETLEEGRLRPEWRAGMAALRDYVLHHAAAKEVGGRFVNGPMLVGLARSYVAAINGGGIPSIADAWDAAAGAQCGRAAAAAL